MRDGVQLRADIYRPNDEKRYPAILCRLPYNKEDPLMHLESILPFRALDAGFAIVYQDTRGRYQSGGSFYPFLHEGQDGYDTVEWVAHQTWCTGALGMTGASYFGATQWLTAIQQPVHLKAICPVVTSSEYYQGWTYQGGAFQLGFILLWTLTGLAPDTANRLEADENNGAEKMAQLLEQGDQIWEHYRHLPLNTLQVLDKTGAADYYFRYLQLRPEETRIWPQLADAYRQGADTPVQKQRAIELHYRALALVEDAAVRAELNLHLAELLLDAGLYAAAAEKAGELGDKRILALSHYAQSLGGDISSKQEALQMLLDALHD